MMIARRDLLKAMAALAAAGLLPAGVDLTARADAASVFEIGDFKVRSVSDGNLVFPLSFLLPEMPLEEVKRVFADNGLATDGIKPACNLTVVTTPEAKIIFDVGSGTNFMPSAGKLAENLEAVEIDPSEVTHVVFTHAHPDHLWGLLDDFDEPVFAEAQYMIHQAEWAYWRDPKTLETTPEQRLAFVVGAKRNLDTLDGNISLFDYGEEIIAGVQAIDTSGHTPGHASFEVRSGGESVFVTGDAITHPLVSFAHPEWRIGSDQDRDKGILSRKMLLDRAKNEQARIVGYHLPQPGIGRVEADGTAYRYVAGRG